MSIAKDTAWPADLFGLFECSARHLTYEDRYYGAYNGLLRYCFSHHASIAPGNPYSDLRLSTHPILFFVVYDLPSGNPILLVEIKDDDCAGVGALRRRADEQMRELYDEFLPKCELPRLWGLSLLGTSLRVYCGDTGLRTVHPPSVVPSKLDRIKPWLYLADEWDLDILSQEGFQKMKEVVGDIRGDT